MNELPLNLPVASRAWLFAGDLGRFFIWAGLILFLVAAVLHVSAKKNPTLFFILGCSCIFAAFITLGALIVNNQFEYSYVFEHSEPNNALQYKIATIWSGQEGSFLLWATTSAIFALLTVWSTGIYRRWFTVIYSVFLAALCGILAYESPFVVQRIHGFAYVPPTGMGLAPSLQNYWVVIHPPTIFLGFGSLTVLFAYAMSALITRNFTDWTRLARPWALVSMSLVGLGLCMGGLWAYETLGWGGFWKWDPVENVSFVPWAFLVALVHGLIVQGTKGKWTFSNLFLAGMPFLLFCYGTFLTRAGFLDKISVHSFAEMDHTAHMVLLAFLLLAVASFLTLWVLRWRRHPITVERKERGTYREGWYRFGSLFVVLLGAATAIGMSVPLIQYLSHQKPAAVEEHVYHLVLSWFFVPTMLMMAIAPFVSWRAMSLKQLGNRIFNVFSVTIGLLGVIMLVMNSSSYGVPVDRGELIDFPNGMKVSLMPWVTFIIGLCLFVGVANIWRIAELWKKSKPSIGGFIAHIGVATAMAGLIISRALEHKQTYVLQEQQPSFSIDANSLPYTLTLQEVDPQTLFDKNNRLQLDVVGDGGKYTVHPGFYYRNDIQKGLEQMAWPAIHRELSHDSYFALQGQQLQATPEPINLKPGETKAFTVTDWQSLHELTYKVTYKKFAREGQVASACTKMLAQCVVELPNGKKIEANPGMAIAGQGGPEFIPADLDGDFNLSVAGMNVADLSMNFQLGYDRPIYILEFFYKPMVILVWLGAGILFVGGLLTAWYRRKVTRSARDIETVQPAPAVKTEENALAPTA